MADLTIWWGMQDMPGGAGSDTAPALILDDDTGLCVVETVADCTTSKQTAAAPALQGRDLVPFVALASGGDLWFMAGDNPTAVAAAAQNIRLPAGVPMSGYMQAGKRGAAINA